MIATYLGAWCTMMSLAFVWPQVWRTVRHDTTHGISAFSVAHGLVGSALWFTYGVSTGRFPVWFSNSSFIVAQCVIVRVLHRHGRMPLRLLTGLGATLAALLALLAPVSHSAVGWAAIVASGTSLIPQVVHVARTDNLHGISIASWTITIVSATSWMIYGWVVGDQIMSIINYFTIPMMIFIVSRATAWRTANGVPVWGRAAPVVALETN